MNSYRTNHTILFSAFFFVLLALLLSGCGGGGSNSVSTTSPSVVSTTPANNATGVPVDTKYTARFSNHVAPVSLTSTTFFINGVPATSRSMCNIAYLTPTSSLSPNTKYDVTISGVTTRLGIPITPFFGTFTTGTLETVRSFSAGDLHTLAIKSDGTLWAWGRNSSGELGDGTTIDKILPIQVGTSANWSLVSAGAGHTVALKSDGTLWTWGNNFAGQLGNGTTVNQTSPIQIGTATNWSLVSAGGAHTVALKSDGTLWAWGNTFTTVTQTSPIQIGTATNWSLVSAGGAHTVALKSDGTLWAWGRNSFGQLGDGTTALKTVPTQIGTATNWSSVESGANHTFAIRSDGTLWAWGYNLESQLGDGTAISKSLPIQIGSATNWSAVSTGLSHTVAIKADGSLWAWGTYLDVASGAIAYQATPLQVGVETNWSSVAAGYSFSVGDSFAVKSDGTLWAWGYNQFGQLGMGDTTNRAMPSPVVFSSAKILPAIPSGVTAIGGASQITVSWNDVPNADYYTITGSVGLRCVTSPYTLKGVPAGIQNVTVYATNAYGDGLISSAVSATVTSPNPPPGTGGSSIVGIWAYSANKPCGTISTTFTFNSDGTYSYNNNSCSSTPGGPNTYGTCQATGSYSTSGSTLTIITTTTSSMCGTILSPYVVTYSISGTTLTMSGDPQNYTKQ